jgi:hypothetical protein
MEHFYRRLDTPTQQRVTSLENFSLPPYANSHLVALEAFRAKLQDAYTVAEEAYGTEVQSIVEYHENQKTAVMHALIQLKKNLKADGSVGKPIKHTNFLNDLGSFRGEVSTAEVLKAFSQAHQAISSLHLPEVLNSMTQAMEKLGAAAKEGKEGVQAPGLSNKLDGFDKAFRKYSNAYLGNKTNLKKADAVECLDNSSVGGVVQEAEKVLRLHDEIIRGLKKFADTAEKVGQMLDPNTKGNHYRHIFKIVAGLWLLAWGVPGIILAGGVVAVVEILAVMGMAWATTRLDEMRNKTLDGEAKQDRAAGREGREFIQRVAEVLTHCEALGGLAADYVHWSTK